MTGTLHRIGERAQLRFTRDLDASVEAVWDAITDKTQLLAWFPMPIEGDWVVDGDLTFRSDVVGDFTGRVLTVDPPSVLEFTWGPDTLRLEIESRAGGARLTLVDTFDELGKAARDSAGWHVCLDNLQASLLGQPPTEHGGSRWVELYQSYVAELGPEAATAGIPAGVLKVADS